jgi:hypothetical protein
MKIHFQLMLIIFFSIAWSNMIYSSNFISADNPNIQYFGRWDFSDKLHPKFSWPGVYIYAEFTGTKIGIRLNDKTSYYNIYIDGNFYKVFHGTGEGETEYLLAENLENKNHTIRFSRRNISFDEVFSFGGFILDDGAELLILSPKVERKIEFIGDSYTAAESNESDKQELEWEARFSVTNIDKGFAALIANHFNAQYTTTCRSGIGMVCDWQGDTTFAMPKFFDRTLMDLPEPKWDFKNWIPDVVFICLGLNDNSGLKNKDGEVPEEKSEFFRKGYHNFLKTVRENYMGAKIILAASYSEWGRKNIKQVYDEEISGGKEDVFYTQFDYFEGGYVAYGHPTIETHKKMADQIIQSIEPLNLFAH